jgi:hypothetical protein
MIGILLCLASAAFVSRMATRGLGNAVGAVLAVGYAYGILRARVNDSFCHFVFDAAVVSLYATQFWGPRATTNVRSRAVMPWIGLLIAWPLFVFFIPLQHIFIQAVGLRAAVFFLPCVLIGARCEREDADVISRWLVVLNVGAFAFAVGEYLIGLESFYPRNQVTQLIYYSHDVGTNMSHRIPATFPNAHAYAGTMVATLPFLLVHWQRTVGVRARILASSAILATSLAVFMAAARQPVVILFLEMAIVGLTVRLTPRMKAGILALGCIVGVLVAQTERFQRFLTLRDTDMVAERVVGSVNMTFFDVLEEYPLGAGLGSAVGTSVPYFLWEYQSRPQIGMENEYGRIAVEQSLIGLGLWLAFIVSTLRHRWSPLSPEWALGTRMMKVFVIASWGTAFIGTGMLTSIPSTAVLLFEMGLLWREPAAVPSRNARSSGARALVTVPERAIERPGLPGTSGLERQDG